MPLQTSSLTGRHVLLQLVQCLQLTFAGVRQVLHQIIACLQHIQPLKLTLLCMDIKIVQTCRLSQKTVLHLTESAAQLAWFEGQFQRKCRVAGEAACLKLIQQACVALHGLRQACIHNLPLFEQRSHLPFPAMNKDDKLLTSS